MAFKPRPSAPVSFSRSYHQDKPEMMTSDRDQLNDLLASEHRPSDRPLVLVSLDSRPRIGVRRSLEIHDRDTTDDIQGNARQSRRVWNGEEIRGRSHVWRRSSESDKYDRPQFEQFRVPPGPMNINQSALDPPEPNATGKQQTAFSFVHDPSKSTADVTVKLVMELEDDLELDVEEFFRLRRLGRFKDAKEYYKARLQHHNDLPYVRLIYAEMLFATGDYAAFHTVPRMFSRSQDELHHSHDSLIQRNHEFLCVLVQSRNLEPIDYGYVNELIRDSYSLLRRQMSISSAEIQLFSVSLLVLYQEELHKYQTNNLITDAETLWNWQLVYDDLQQKNCVWDLRDLLVAMDLVFGWEDTRKLVFGSESDDDIFSSIINNWLGPQFDESSALGLLDLFTSLILQDSSDDFAQRNILLAQKAISLVQSLQLHDKDLMRSRPYIRWLLAKSLLEMEPPPGRLYGNILQSFRGLLINQGKGLNLPLYAPRDRKNKPGWDVFSKKPTTDLTGVLETAAETALLLGDFALNTESMKLQILQSHEPRPLMDALCRFQLDTQGDKEGYMATCLSKYIVSSEESDLAILLGRLMPRRSFAPFREWPNRALSWAWELITTHLSFPHEDSDSSVAAEYDNAITRLLERTIYDPRRVFPAYIVDFAVKELGLRALLHRDYENSFSQSPPVPPLSSPPRVAPLKNHSEHRYGRHFKSEPYWVRERQYPLSSDLPVRPAAPDWCASRSRPGSNQIYTRPVPPSDPVTLRDGGSRHDYGGVRVQSCSPSASRNPFLQHPAQVEEDFKRAFPEKQIQESQDYGYSDSYLTNILESPYRSHDYSSYHIADNPGTYDYSHYSTANSAGSSYNPGDHYHRSPSRCRQYFSGFASYHPQLGDHRQRCATCQQPNYDSSTTDLHEDSEHSLSDSSPPSLHSSDTWTSKPLDYDTEQPRSRRTKKQPIVRWMHPLVPAPPPREKTSLDTRMEKHWKNRTSPADGHHQGRKPKSMHTVVFDRGKSVEKWLAGSYPYASSDSGSDEENDYVEDDGFKEYDDFDDEEGEESTEQDGDEINYESEGALVMNDDSTLLSFLEDIRFSRPYRYEKPTACSVRILTKQRDMIDEISKDAVIDSNSQRSEGNNEEFMPQVIPPNGPETDRPYFDKAKEENQKQLTPSYVPYLHIRYPWLLELMLRLQQHYIVPNHTSDTIVSGGPGITTLPNHRPTEDGSTRIETAVESARSEEVFQEPVSGQGETARSGPGPIAFTEDSPGPINNPDPILSTVCSATEPVSRTEVATGTIVDQPLTAEPLDASELEENATLQSSRFATTAPKPPSGVPKDIPVKSSTHPNFKKEKARTPVSFAPLDDIGNGTTNTSQFKPPGSPESANATSVDPTLSEYDSAMADTATSVHGQVTPTSKTNSTNFGPTEFEEPGSEAQGYSSSVFVEFSASSDKTVTPKARQAENGTSSFDIHSDTRHEENKRGRKESGEFEEATKARKSVRRPKRRSTQERLETLLGMIGEQPTTQIDTIDSRLEQDPSLRFWICDSSGRNNDGNSKDFIKSSLAQRFKPKSQKGRVEGNSRKIGDQATEPSSSDGWTSMPKRSLSRNRQSSRDSYNAISDHVVLDPQRMSPRRRTCSITEQAESVIADTNEGVSADQNSGKKGKDWTSETVKAEQREA